MRTCLLWLSLLLAACSCGGEALAAREPRASLQTSQQTDQKAGAPVTAAGVDDDSRIALIEAPRLPVSEPSAADTTAPGAGAPDETAPAKAIRHGRLSLAALMAETGTPGLSVAYFADGEVVWTRAWGVADAESGALVTDRTLFQAASISKPVAAAAILEAVERGLIHLDLPINDQLRSWRLPDNDLTARRDVTPRLLLCHAGGTTVHGFPGYEPTAPLPSVQDVLEGAGGANTTAVRVDLEPGTQERYSGGGTTILQLLLADVTRRPFPAILEEWVLRPAGMSDSAFDQPPSPDRAARTARAHLVEGATGAASWHVYPELAAAGLWTTPRDLALLAIEIGRARRGASDRILDTESARLMTTPAGIGDFGLGFETRNRGGDGGEEVWYFGHTGGNWGFRSLLVASRDDGYGMVAMINGSDFDLLLEVQRRVALVYGWKGDFGPPRSAASPE